MAKQRYKALSSVLVAGKPHAEGSTFNAELEHVRVALARGLVSKAPQPKPKPRQSK